MKKLSKRIISAIVSCTMVFGIAGATVNAAQYEADWALRRVKAPGAPSNCSVSSITEQLHPVSSKLTFKTFTENCSSFSSNKAEIGKKAEVRYWTYIKDKNGNTKSIGFSSHYHVETDPYRTFTLVTPVKYEDTLVVRYVLENPYDVGCTMSGHYKVN